MGDSKEFLRELDQLHRGVSRGPETLPLKATLGDTIAMVDVLQTTSPE